MRIPKGKLIGDIFEQELPSGTVNGSNTAFTMSSTPHSDKSVRVYLNGLRQIRTTHYSISGSTITFVTAPELGQTVYVEYIKRN